jgi:hypothetical protein
MVQIAVDWEFDIGVDLTIHSVTKSAVFFCQRTNRVNIYVEILNV